jgi:tetratricopeptide (TPR) repeat protein
MSEMSEKRRFLVLLKDEDDADGLARLLNDVRAFGAERLVEFEAPRPGGVDYLRSEAAVRAEAVAKDQLLILQDEPGLEDVIPGRAESIIVGVSDPYEVQRFAGLPGVTTFVAAGPLDFAVELMDRFSGPDAPVRLFDPDEAARMRALASSFPVDELYGPVSHAEERLEAGSQDLADGRTADAVRVFDELLVENPDWWKAHLMRGRALRKLADEGDDRVRPQAREDAVAAFHAALDTGAPEIEEIGEQLLGLGDYVSAAIVLRRAVEQRPDAPWLYNSLGTALALDEQLDDRFEQACDAYTDGLKQDPTNTLALLSRGVAYVNLCCYDAALKDLNRALELGDEEPLTHMYRAVALGALGELREAVKAAAQASRRPMGCRPEWIAYVAAVAHLRMDDLDRAQDALGRAEALTSEQDEDVALRAKIRAVRAVILARLSQFDHAYPMCDASIKLDPTEPLPYAMRAWMLQRADRLDDAMAAITRAVELVETDPEWSRNCRYAGARWPFYVIQASVLNALSERYADEELAERAIEATVRALGDFEILDHQPRRCAPADKERGAQIFLERAYASILSRDPVQAAAALRQARALAPPRSTPWFAATRALRAPESPRIPTWAIASAEGLAMAGSVALLLFGRLASAAFATLVIGLVALGLVAYALPYITRLGLGTLQLEKVVARASAQSLPRLAAPLPAPAIPMPPPRARLPEIPLRWFPD